MPFRPEHSLLRVEVPALGSIDTTNVESLFGMWSLFSKTSHCVEQGRRLENLSWRLWNRETFCCALPLHQRHSPQRKLRAVRLASGNSMSKPSAAAAADNIPVPELSSSLSSAGSDEEYDTSSFASPPSIRTLPKGHPEPRRNDSSGSRREKHITPVDLEKIVISIKDTPHLERSIDLPMPTHATKPTMDPPATSASQTLPIHSQAHENSDESAPHPSASHPTLLESSASTVDTMATADNSDTQVVGSVSSSNTEMRTHSIVRGFELGGTGSSYRSQTYLPVKQSKTSQPLQPAQPTPILKTSPQYREPVMPKKKAPMFTIGTSSGEDESSLDTHMNKTSFKSTLSESLKKQGSDSGSDESNGSKKTTTFKNEIAIGQAAESQDSPVFEDSDDEDDGVSESAIEDDDDSSDWEDSDDQSGPSSVNEKELFQRVDSRPNLTSRRSLLTTLMHEPDRAKALQNAASRSTPAIRRARNTTPNGPSVPGSPAEPVGQMPRQDSARSKPIIMTTSNTHPPQMALSPKTTRRNMLSTELTESLRRNLLWERQHRSTGNLAALKRRHTAQDMTKLKQHPEPVALSHKDKNDFSNDYFHAGLQEYHAKGW
ncbi:DUF1752-domain-containing protein [Teratosphaeria nubilosa]|uniref:DUF1752-domain-containing protein n=1 Tax=Teratosphaeria nubilosa TaxID=161662 RepID=A0A6G1KVT3_9PEZI|nr:DUF1752-domain-containing protein [Teratosphaeria nubilosa]